MNDQQPEEESVEIVNLREGTLLANQKEILGGIPLCGCECICQGMPEPK
ncbi:hypothetical protein ACFL1X_00675 [Candidatus Hydrogenedentota bacterium]